VPGIAPKSKPQKHSARHRDPIYLFACHLDWRINRNVKAYQELVAALDDRDERTRDLAAELLQRCSPRPQAKEAQSKTVRP
jgi:hypothetical protein